MTHAERYADWKARHPDRHVALEVTVARRLGMRRGITSELARETVDQWCASVVGALLGWGEEPEPESEPSPPSPVKAAVIKVLDLEEIPLSGRDRAAGVEK